MQTPLSRPSQQNRADACEQTPSGAHGVGVLRAACKPGTHSPHLTNFTCPELAAPCVQLLRHVCPALQCARCPAPSMMAPQINIRLNCSLAQALSSTTILWCKQTCWKHLGPVQQTRYVRRGSSCCGSHNYPQAHNTTSNRITDCRCRGNAAHNSGALIRSMPE